MPFRRTALSLLLPLAAFGALPSTTALAQDRFHATRSPELVEKAHEIELRMDYGHAELTVQRTMFNGASRHDQAIYHIEIPFGAVATGLRTQAIQNGQPVWFKGELMEAEAAAAKYKELTGLGGYYPKDPALLSWRHQQLLALQVFPVEPKKPKVVEYTLHMPTKYLEGRDEIQLPKMGSDKIAAQLVVRSTSTEDKLLIDGKSVESGTKITLDKEEGVTIALKRAYPQRIDGLFASVPFAKNRVLNHFRIEAAEKLSETPKGAYIVVVIDASRSLNEQEIAAEKAAAQAYLSHFRDAHVEVITFDRRPHERFSGFSPVSKVLKDWGNLKIERHNGSAVDDALARADSLLAKAPAQAAKRVVLFTDLRTRTQITPERTRARISKSGALLHIGVLGAGQASLQRDDEHPWMKLVKPTGGLVWNAFASTDPGDAELMRGVYEELARPLRIDTLKIKAQGIPDEELFTPPVLNEGEGFEDLRIVARQIPWVELSGLMWSKPVKRMITPDPREGKLWSALVFGSELLNELSEQEMMPLAKLGGAVSPVTSYLAIEPGVRPSTEGLIPEETFMSGGLGLSGVGEGGGGRGSGIGLGLPDREGFLTKTLQEKWKGCKGQGPVTLKIQSTLVEIADVQVSGSGKKNAAALSCLEEESWGIELPPMFSDAWQEFQIQL